MNYMAKIAEMLGVELGEEFLLKRDESLLHPHYSLTQEGIKRCDTEQVFDVLLTRICRGDLTIVKLPWRPKKNDTYYWIDEKGDIHSWAWGSAVDSALYTFGNCFHTITEAEAHKDEVLAKMKEVLAE